MSDITYMRSTTVVSVGDGAITDENGRSLRMIGNLPVQPGDTVWTDGHIVYGHRPVRPNVGSFNVTQGYPFRGFNVGLLRKNGTPYGHPEWYAPEYLWLGIPRDTDPLWNTFNWVYTTKDAIYCAKINDYNPTPQYAGDLNFFLDIVVGDKEVYTADFSSEDAAWNGKACSPKSGRYRNFRFFARNFYYTQIEGTQNFGFRFTSQGEVACNPILRIRRNGTIVTQFDLGQFDFALTKLKEIYLAYNNDGEDADIWKRYSQEALYDGEALQGVDIWCTYLHNQVLNFTFTDDKGAWEMILLTIAEGVVSPHTVDQEYDEEDDEYKDVSSFYHVYCPIVCYTLRVKSTGAIEVLQQWLVVNKNVDNGVDNGEWVNAKSAPVTEINAKNFPTILIDCGNGCRIATDFRNRLEGEINGTPLPFRLSSNKICGYFETTNPDKSVIDEGSVNSYRRERVSNGNVEINDQPRIGLWCTNDAYAFCEDIDMGCAQLVAGTFSYYGRLSEWTLDNGKLVYSMLGNVCRVFTDSPDPEAVQYETLSNYCFNVNLEYLPSVRRATRNLKDFNQFVADVTSGKINS